MKEVDYMEQIPVWKKYVITPEEASLLFALPAEFFRLAGHLTKKEYMIYHVSGVVVI